MPKLITCRTCGQKVSSNTRACPGCGEEDPEGKKKQCGQCGNYFDWLEEFKGYSKSRVGKTMQVCRKCRLRLQIRDGDDVRTEGQAERDNMIKKAKGL